MKVPAYATGDPKSPLKPFVIDRREPGPRDVQIEIEFCGVCHSDIHQARDEWGGAMFPMVPGHEIVGRVTSVGGSVSKWKGGQTVGVGVIVDSCRECAPCRSGEEVYCLNSPSYTYNSRERDGTPTFGGYSTHITVNEDYVFHIPENIPSDRAAPLLCAGITTYSQLRHWGVKAGQSVAVIGLGGLGHMGVKYAKALGAEVTVLSHSPSKQADAKRLGASDFIVISPGSLRANSERFDFLLDTVSAPHEYTPYLGLLKVDGIMALVGLPPPGLVRPQALADRRRSLVGSSTGGMKETQDMIDFSGEHGIGADVEKIPIQKINEAFERTLRSDVKYRFVIDMSSLRVQPGRAA